MAAGDTLIEQIAQVTHEANRAYCATLGDLSQAAWNEAPEWQRESARQGVRNILDGTVKSPMDSHVSWMDHKLAEGWQYGPTKDPERKQHPCLMPYTELPADQRRKDSLFFAVVRALVE